MIWDKMLDSVVFAFFTGILAFIIYFVYLKIRKQNLNENFSVTIFLIIFIFLYIFIKFFLIDFIKKENRDIRDYITTSAVETEKWSDDDINELIEFYSNFYDSKLMETEFKDYRNNMKSTHIIYKNAIIESAITCVIYKIKSKFPNQHMYLKSNFVENDNILINECISNETKQNIYSYLTSYWNEFTETEIIDNVSKGTILAIKKYQVFSTKDTESLNEIIAMEATTCIIEELKNKYPNYSDFNYGFYEIKSPEVVNEFNKTKDGCVSKILRKWYK